MARTDSILYSRREVLKRSAALTGLAALAPLWSICSPGGAKTYKISVCDWSLGRQNRTDALKLAKKIGLDGVQVSLGSVENNMHLRRQDVQQAYLAASRETGVEISSLAIGELNRVPYKSAPETEEWVSDSIDVAEAMDCRVILLAFFGNGDLRGDPSGKKEVIRRLRKVVPKAEKAGVILGIESWLSAGEHLEIIDAVGSDNVRVYYDVANSNKMGYDIYEEMSHLGSEYICEVHAKENGYLLGQGKVDFKRVKEVLDDIDYQGWVILEGALPEGADHFEAYVANTRYLNSVFNP